MPKSRQSSTRAPMAGRAAFRHGSPCGEAAGRDCADYHLTAGELRRVEEPDWRRTEVPALLPPADPLEDLADCVHGCAGCLTSGSDRCNFTCHESVPAR